MSDSTATVRSRIAGPRQLTRSLIRYCVSGALLASVLFLISGRLEWTRAWVFIAVTLGIQVVVVVALHRKNPALLVERSRIQPDTKAWDKVLAPAVAIAGPVAIWCVAAWDVRMHWPPAVAGGLSAASLLACVLGSLLVFWAMLSNPFFSATVRIQTDRGHVVVDGGPYRYMRHPGYSGALLFTMASPLALGSWWALVPAVLTTTILILRTALEDATLRKELAGYSDFASRVQWRLVPALW